MIKVTVIIGTEQSVRYIGMLHIVQMFSGQGGTRIELSSGEILTVKENFEEINMQAENTMNP